jgi:hypothetical protein
MSEKTPERKFGNEHRCQQKETVPPGQDPLELEKNYARDIEREKECLPESASQMMRRARFAQYPAIRQSDAKRQKSEQPRKKTDKKKNDTCRFGSRRVDSKNDAEPRTEREKRKQADPPQIGGKRHSGYQKNGFLYNRFYFTCF